MSQLQVGQKLWFVPSDEREVKYAADVSIVSVGRKWATLSNHHRIDMATLRADGRRYASPGRCWLRKEDWEQQVRVTKAYSQFARQVGYTPYEGVTLEDIAKAAGLLGIILEI